MVDFAIEKTKAMTIAIRIARGQENRRGQGEEKRKRKKEYDGSTVIWNI